MFRSPLRAARSATVALSAAVLVLAGAAQARAAVIPFTDYGTFAAATGLDPRNNPTEGYDTYAIGTTIPAAGGALGPFGYTFTTPFPGNFNGARISNMYDGFGVGVFAATRPSAGDSDYGPGERITVNFGRLVNAVGIFFATPEGVAQAGDYYIETPSGRAYNGPPSTAIFGEGTAALTPNVYFVGLIADAPFSSATFGSLPYTLTPAGVPQPGAFTLDNLTIGTVPAPATVVVFGALALVACVRFRRAAVA